MCVLDKIFSNNKDEEWAAIEVSEQVTQENMIKKAVSLQVQMIYI